jgi:succinate dehydrogenase/fumarate reductase flavoprotein subunit
MVTDYHSHLPEQKAPRGRSIFPSNADGTRNVAGGSFLTSRMKATLDRRQVPLLMEHRVSRLVVNSKREVIGVEATKGTGEIVTVRARRGVIFGSGGFTQNPELCHNHLWGQIYGGCAVPTNEGDFVYLGTAVGAKLGNMKNAWWSRRLLEQALQSRSSSNLAGQPSGDSMITVNRLGRRCMNEKYPSNGNGQHHFEWDQSTNTYPNLIEIGIYDQFTRERFGGMTGAVVKPGVNAPYVLTGMTWEDLAKAIDDRLATLADKTGNFRLDSNFTANLKQTIARFNQFAETGKDLDFLRGESPMERSERRSGNDKPNPTMYPISATGPYYAVLIAAGTLDTNGGPRINAKAEVVDAKDAPIPGLYGAGNCIASPAGQTYWGHGGTIGPAIVFGRLAAQNAAKAPVKAVT